MAEYSELKVIKVVDDIEKFENEVNNWCCNHGYKIMSCTSQKMTQGGSRIYTYYTAFLGK